MNISSLILKLIDISYFQSDYQLLQAKLPLSKILKKTRPSEANHSFILKELITNANQSSIQIIANRKALQLKKEKEIIIDNGLSEEEFLSEEDSNKAKNESMTDLADSIINEEETESDESVEDNAVSNEQIITQESQVKTNTQKKRGRPAKSSKI